MKNLINQNHDFENLFNSRIDFYQLEYRYFSGEIIYLENLSLKNIHRIKKNLIEKLKSNGCNNFENKRFLLSDEIEFPFTNKKGRYLILLISHTRYEK